MSAPAPYNIVKNLQKTDVVLCNWGLFCACPVLRGPNRPGSLIPQSSCYRIERVDTQDGKERQ